jgi:hypothetical protein
LSPSSNLSRYNSAVFKTLTARQYSVFVVDESFLQGAAFNENLSSYTWLYDSDADGAAQYYWSGTAPMVGESPLREMQQNNTLQRLSPSECMAAYATDFLTDRGSLLAVTNSAFIDNASAIQVGATTNGSVYGWSQSKPSISTGRSPDAYENDPLAWMCADIIGYDDQYYDAPCNLSFAQKAEPNWTIFNYTIDYCLNQPKDEVCSLEFSQVIMIVTITANAIKALCMALTVISFRAESPLVTIG